VEKVVEKVVEVKVEKVVERVVDVLSRRERDAERRVAHEMEAELARKRNPRWRERELQAKREAKAAKEASWEPQNWRAMRQEQHRQDGEAKEVQRQNRQAVVANAHRRRQERVRWLKSQPRDDRWLWEVEGSYEGRLYRAKAWPSAGRREVWQPPWSGAVQGGEAGMTNGSIAGMRTSLVPVQVAGGSGSCGSDDDSHGNDDDSHGDDDDGYYSDDEFSITHHGRWCICKRCGIKVRNTSSMRDRHRQVRCGLSKGPAPAQPERLEPARPASLRWPLNETQFPVMISAVARRDQRRSLGQTKRPPLKRDYLKAVLGR